MNEQDILDETYEIVEELKQSELYKRIQSSLQEFEDDVLGKELVYLFEKARDAYLHAKPMKDYYPDFDKIQAKYIEAKTNLYEYPLYKNYQTALREMNQSLSEFSMELNELMKTLLVDANKSCKR